jgi:WD40 repeat protein
LYGEQLLLKRFEGSKSLAIHPDGTRFVLGAEWSLRAFDDWGNELWTNAVPGIPAWAVNISDDGRLVIAAYSDGTIRWHRMEDGAELLALFPLINGKDWVVWTPEGVYSATPGAQGILRWHVNRGWDMAAEAIPPTRSPRRTGLTLSAMCSRRWGPAAPSSWLSLLKSGTPFSGVQGRP